ncbi:MAG: site-specific DNA-methyltransferase [Candidatus Moranbacteria bacterium]|nr:site-specific DNA-methyltransferase [Candidatus Moranbacteria bacterium]
MEKLTAILKKDSRFIDQEGELLKSEIIDKAYKIDKGLIELLLEDEEIAKQFFTEIKKHWIFDINAFVAFIQDKNFLNDSYTNYKNKIGLNIGGKFLNERKEVSLVWPFKDCILEAGMTKEDEKRKEIFFNEILAHDEIDKLFAPKVLMNWKRLTRIGKAKVNELKRNEKGIIKENLIIKGNNLLALHTIKKQFKGQIKLIYIDPPYNTGSDSFKYNDNFNHSTWLTFIKNRLEIAKELLREDGVIFVQCDDAEQAYLKVLMDELFGRENFISTITVVSDARTRNYESLSKTHEFICVYAKTPSYVLHQIIDEDKKFTFSDEKGGFDIYELRNRNIAFNEKNRPNLLYPFYLNPKNKDNNGFFEISLEEKTGWIKILPLKSKGIQTVWRWGKEKSSKNINSVLFGKESSGGFQIIKKYREKTSPLSTVWNGKEVLTDRGTLQIKALFGEKLFDFPKPEEFIKKILDLSTRENDIVLDFFSGSGTTLAVAHKMNRQYIGIEQMDYINDLPEARLIKVIAGEQGGISKAVKWQGGGEFVYCELAKYNEVFIEKIEKAKDTKELLRIWEEMKKRSFLNYNIDLKKINETIEEFKSFSIARQKEILLEMLNKNQLYVNLSEIKDKEFEIGDNEMKLNEKFYE